MAAHPPATPRIGLALGSGAARGWAHLGVIAALAEAGIRPQVVCGTSIGALVGAALAAGEFDRLTRWAEGLGWTDVVGLLDVSLKSGLIKGERLIRFFERNFVDREFAALDVAFACVATDLATGGERWLRQGSVAQAVHASLALPGLMTPVLCQGRLLVDGGLVNPVPVSLCRAMGAEVVIAVDLNTDVVGRALRDEPARSAVAPDPEDSGLAGWSQKVMQRFGLVDSEARENGLPSIAAVLATSINIMQTRISRSRLAGEPADVLITPRVAQLAILDFHRAREAIAEGRAAVARSQPFLDLALGR